MADPENIAEQFSIVEQVNYRQSLMPYHTKGSFAGEDEDYHDFRFAARGKNVIAFWIDNPTDDTLTWELYGLHDPAGAIDDPGASKVTEGTVLTEAAHHAYVHAYPFPFYLMRLYFAAEPTDDPAETVSLWIDLYWGKLEIAP